MSSPLPQNQAKGVHFLPARRHLRGCGDYMLPQRQYRDLFYTWCTENRKLQCNPFWLSCICMIWLMGFVCACLWEYLHTTPIKESIPPKIGTQQNTAQHHNHIAWSNINYNKSYNSKIVGTSLGKADFNCVRVIRPTIWPKASTEDMRTYFKQN